MGLEVLLPPYPVLHGSSIWLLLSCILNNKAVTSPYRFQHMDSVPRTCTYTEIKYHFVFYSIAHTGFKPSPASSDQSFNYPKYCVLPSQLSSSLEASEQEKKKCFPLSRYSHLFKSHIPCIDLKIFRLCFLHLVFIVPSCKIYSHCWKCQLCYPIIKNFSKQYVLGSPEMLIAFDQTNPFPESILWK